MAYQKLKQEHYNNFGGINVFDSQYQTGETKFLDLRNFTFERPGKLSSRPGQEYHLTLNSATYLVKPKSSHQFVKRDGASYIVFDSGTTLHAYNGAFVGVFASLTANVTTALPIDFEAYDNLEFFANGHVFGILKDTDAFYYNLPTTAETGQTILGISFNTALTSGPTAVLGTGAWIGSFEFARGYSDIYQGPFHYPTFRNNKFGEPLFNPEQTASISPTLVSRGRWVMWGFTITPGYGISGIIPFIKYTIGATIFNSATPVAAYLTTFGGGVTYWAAEFDHPATDAGFDSNRSSFTIAPQYLGLFNNQLMMAGFSSSPSTLWFSEPGEPDNVQPDNFIELRSGEGESITGLEVFQDAIIVFKKKRVFEISGQDAESFQLRELTNEYGLMGDRAKVVFENRLWFMDSSGVIEYDGANFKLISEPVTLYLDQVDKSNAYAVHVKKKRQVWFCASSKCFVYDYDVGAWTIFDNVSLDAVAGAFVPSYGATRSDVSYWTTGTSFHELVRFGDSLSTDFGVAITLVAQTRFHKRLEHTTQELWRQLYVNQDITGSTQGLTMQLIPDYGTSVYAARSTYLDDFQKRVQFGVSSRSLSVKFIMQASQPISFNGYALESRFLRKV